MTKPGHRVYETVVFLQGDDYNAAEEHVERAVHGDYDPLVTRSGSYEWDRALLDYLLQWEYGEHTGDRSTESGIGCESDVSYWRERGHGAFAIDRKRVPRAGYAISYSTSYGYAGLTRITWVEDTAP